MTAHDGPLTEQARSIVEQMISTPLGGGRTMPEGFKIEDVGTGLLVSRRQHALGLISRDADGFVFTHVAYSEPVFRSPDLDKLVEYLVDVIAHALSARIPERKQ